RPTICLAGSRTITSISGAQPILSAGVGQPTWANWCMSGPWLCAHLYEHYRFTRDREFLRTRAYPLMKGSAEFCLAWLIPDGQGRLTTCPSESTENNFMAPDGKPAMTSAGLHHGHGADSRALHQLHRIVERARHRLRFRREARRRA